MATAVLEPKAAGAKLSLRLRDLQRAMTSVVLAVERKTTIPVLASVRVEQAAQHLDFAATNLDLTVRYRLNYDGKGDPAPFLLPAQKLESFARLLAGETVNLSCAETRATLSCGRNRTQLPMQSVANFPALSLREGETGIQIPQAAAERMLAHTTFAIATEESRYTLSGALLEIAEGRLRMITTDGHRLARYSFASEAVADEPMLLPAKLLAAIAKTLSADRKSPLVLDSSDDAIFANVELAEASVAMSHRKMTGKFPNYKAVLPTSFPAVVMADAETMRDALRRCLALADAHNGAVRLKVTGDELGLHSASTDAGETDETVSVTRAGAEFPTFSIGFNATYLLDAFSRLKGEVRMSFSGVDNTSKLLLEAEPEAGETFEYVVMPMRV